MPAFTETNKKRRRKIYVFFEHRETPITVNGEIHTHVELDGKVVGNATTPIVNRNLARIEQLNMNIDVNYCYPSFVKYLSGSRKGAQFDKSRSCNGP